MRLACSDGFEDGGGKESRNDGRNKNSRRFTNDCSTIFRDMHAERDELGKRIFPQLRKLCESRGVT